MITTVCKISYSSQTVPPIVPAVQGDTGRAISFEIADFTPPAGATATYFILKPSGEAVYNSATITDNSILCELTAQSLAEKGENRMQVRVLQGDDIVTSFEVILMVRPFLGDDAIESGTEMDIFDQAVAQATEQFQENAEQIVEEVIESIPEDYTELTEEVGQLNERLDNANDKVNLMYGAFIINYDDVEELQDENGNVIEFPFVMLRDYLTTGEIERKENALNLRIDDVIDDVERINNAIYKFDDVEDLMDENGDVIEFPFLRLDGGEDYITRDEAVGLIEEELKTVSTFIPEDYQYNSGTGGYYQYLPTPILYLDGDVSEMTKDKKVKLDARYNDIHIGCSCKWQGASSIAYPKKNYTVTFNNPVVIKSDWGAKKKYVLKSEFADSTHTRNTVSAKIWADIVRDRELRNGLTTLDDESGNPITLEDGTTSIDVVNSTILGSPGCGCNDGFHVMVVINGEYTGLYTLGIPKDDWMFGMDNGSENCCVLNAEANTNPTKFRATTTKSSIENEQTFSVEYASDDMDIDRIVGSLNDMLTSVINATGSNYRSAIEPYFDVDSAIDYFIYCLLIGNWDGVSHNYNLATYDGEKWAFSAYDLDNTFGIEDLVSWKFENLFDDPADVTPNIPITAEMNRFFWLIYTYGTEEFKARYQYLRSNVLSERHIFTLFYNHLSTVSKRVLSEEYDVWPTTPRSGAQTVDALINWYRLRCDYMDAKVAAL